MLFALFVEGKKRMVHLLREPHQSDGYLRLFVRDWAILLDGGRVIQSNSIGNVQCRAGQRRQDLEGRFGDCRALHKNQLRVCGESGPGVLNHSRATLPERWSCLCGQFGGMVKL